MISITKERDGQIESIVFGFSPDKNTDVGVVVAESLGSDKFKVSIHDDCEHLTKMPTINTLDTYLKDLMNRDQFQIVDDQTCIMFDLVTLKFFAMSKVEEVETLWLNKIKSTNNEDLNG